MPQLKVLLFGPPRITRASGAGAGERDGQPVEIGLNKSVALLVFLAVTKQSHSRDALATLLWPDADQRTALGYLRRALYRVNQTLKEDILTATRKTIEFNHQLDAWLDTEVFQTHVDACFPPPHAAPGPDEECIRRLTEAAELYRDDFLAGFTLPDSPAFDEWQFFQAESLRRSLARVLEQLANAYVAGGGVGACDRLRPSLAGTRPPGGAGPPLPDGTLCPDRPAGGRRAPVCGVSPGPRRGTGRLPARRNHGPV